MKKRAKIAAPLLALLLVLGLAACGRGGTAENSPAPTESPSPSPSPAPFTMRMSESKTTVSTAYFSEPQSLDPALVDGPDSIMLCAHLYEGLMRWEDSGEEAADGQNAARLALGQAERYEKTANADGTVTYTFTLREDARWSDGKAVTAEDFVTGWRRLANSTDSAAYAYLMSNVVNATEIETGAQSYDTLGVSAPDERTFVVKLVADSAEFLEYCAHPATAPLRMDILEKYQSKEWSTDASEWVSNGPYVLSSWSKYSTIRMARNWFYSPHREGPNAIVWRYMADEATALSAFQAGTVDFSRRVPATGREELAKADVLRETDSAGVYYLTYQSNAAPFDDARVREAFTLALDRTALAALDPMAGKSAGGFVPYGVYDAPGAAGEDFRTQGKDFYSTDREDYEENCRRARELLAQAGYPEGKDFPEVTYLYNTGDTHKKVAEAMKEMWETALGVKVTLMEESWEEYIFVGAHGGYSIAKGSWIADHNDPQDFLYLCTSISAGVWYENEDYDALLMRAEEAGGQEERMRLYHQAEEMLVGRDWAVCPLYFYANRYLVAPNLEGVYLTPLGCYYFDTATRK